MRGRTADGPGKRDHALRILETRHFRRNIDFSVSGFSAAEPLLTALQKQPAAFHLLLLDIELLQGNGVELAGRLRELNVGCSIIYITSYAEYMPDSFATRPLDYLLKPVSEKKLEKAIQWDLQKKFPPGTDCPACQRRLPQSGGPGHPLCGGGQPQVRRLPAGRGGLRQPELSGPSLPPAGEHVLPVPPQLCRQSEPCPQADRIRTAVEQRDGTAGQPDLPAGIYETVCRLYPIKKPPCL